MEEAVAGSICRSVLMQALPAIRENDCAAFGHAISAVQTMNGEYFSAAQGGQYTSQAVADAVHFLQKNGAAGGGQSSWGPTGFAIFANETEAWQALRQARKFLIGDSRVELKMCRARNAPAAVEAEEAILDTAKRR